MSAKSNPVHALIKLLDTTITAFDRCHRAGERGYENTPDEPGKRAGMSKLAESNQEKHRAQAAWRKLFDPFQCSYPTRGEAVLALSGNAIAWCARGGFTNPLYAARIKRAARVAVELLHIPNPCAFPWLYTNRAEAKDTWKKQGQLLNTGIRARDRLRELASWTGVPWMAKPAIACPTFAWEAVTSVSDKGKGKQRQGEGTDAGRDAAAPAQAVEGRPRLPRCAEPILETMLAMGAFSQDTATTRPAVVERINPKQKLGRYRRGFDRLKKLEYTNSAPGRDGGIWLAPAGRERAEEVKRRNDSTDE